MIEAINMNELDLNAGEEARLDVIKGEFSVGTGWITFAPLPGNMLDIVEAGGIFRFFKEKGVYAFGKL